MTEARNTSDLPPVGIPTPADFRAAYSKLCEARLNLFKAEENAIRARRKLAEAEADAIARGIDGKNAEERKANLRLQLADQHLDVDMLESDARDYRLEHELASLEVDCLRHMLRAAEAALRTEAGE